VPAALALSRSSVADCREVSLNARVVRGLAPPYNQKFFGNCPGMEISSTEGKRQRKRFFFEKKNQKTLTNSG
jgi:hypothetical protein